jgi:hypothetical protein
VADRHTLQVLDYKIGKAKAALNEARTAADRSPNAYTLRDEELAEKRVDELLDRRLDVAARITAEINA